jgi:hypothetical protein
MRQHLAKRRARAIDLTQSKISGRRTGEYVADEHADKTAANEQRIGVRRGITIGGQAAPVTLGYPESSHQDPEVAYLGTPCRSAEPVKGFG